jgi:hypothetical protein
MSSDCLLSHHCSDTVPGLPFLHVSSYIFLIISLFHSLFHSLTLSLSLSLSLPLRGGRTYHLSACLARAAIRLIQFFLFCALFQAQLEVAAEAVAAAAEARVSGISTLARQHLIATALSESPRPSLPLAARATFHPHFISCARPCAHATDRHHVTSLTHKPLSSRCFSPKFYHKHDGANDEFW